MACGVPVVASDIAVHREVCGDAALYFEPSDYHALAARLRQLAESRDLRIQRKGEGAGEGAFHVILERSRAPT